jgi:hypothetical protein
MPSAEERKQNASVDYWIGAIEKALTEPEENFPNPWGSSKEIPYDKSAWIKNWLIMSARCSPRAVIEGLRNPPQWLLDWLEEVEQLELIKYRRKGKE